MRRSVAVTMIVGALMSVAVGCTIRMGMHMLIGVLNVVIHRHAVNLQFTGTASAGCTHAFPLYPTSSSLTRISVPPVT